MLVERRDLNNTNVNILNDITLGNTSQISESLTKIENLISDEGCLNIANNQGEITDGIRNLQGILKEIKDIYNTET